MWELDHKEGWAPKNWCFWTVVLEKTLESSLDCKEIKPVNPKGNQPWIFIGRSDAEAEAPILWPPDAKNWLFGKDPGARKDWRQEEKGMTEDGMVGWHHQLNGHGFEQVLGVGDGQGGLACFRGSWHASRGSQRVRHDWVTELIYIHMCMCIYVYISVCVCIHMYIYIMYIWSFPSGSVVRHLPAMQEMWVWSLGWEDPLEEEMATHSSIFAMDRGD